MPVLRHNGSTAPCCCAARRGILLFLLPLVVAWSGVAADPETAPKAPDLTQVPLETLMQMDVPNVFAASKFEQKVTSAPSSVTIVPAEEIKRYGYQTLADVLQSAQGFYVSNDRNYAFLGVRGMSLGDFNSRVLVLVNGHRINNSVSEASYIDEGFILNMDLVDRVEIIRGPGSALYGNNAFFGVINVITRKPAQLNGVEVSGAYGEYDSYKARLSLGKAFTNGLEMLLSASYFQSGGANDLFYKEFNTAALNHGVANGLDAGSAWSIFGSLAYTDFTLEGAFNHRDKTNPTGQFSSGDLTNGVFTFNDPRLATEDARGYTVLKFERTFSDLFDVRAQVYYDHSFYQIGYPFTILSGGDVVSTTFTSEEDTGDSWGAEVQLNKHFYDRHIVTLGGEYKDDFNLSQHTFDANGQPIPGGSSDLTRQSYGIYGQANIELHPTLHFSGGLRYDRYGDYESKVNPRTALIYQPWEQSTFKAIYGTAFRAPNFWELSYSGFQNLKPEEITGYELVYEQGIGKYLRSSVSGFYNEMDNLLVFENGSYNNLNATAAGTELALELLWNGLRGRASYTLQKTENRSSELALPDSPEHLIKLNVSAPLWKQKVFAGLEVLYTSSRNSLHLTSDANGQPRTISGETADPFVVLNLTLFSRDLIKNLELSATVYNLLDQDYSDPASHFHLQDVIGQNGRSFWLKLTYRF